MLGFLKKEDRKAIHVNDMDNLIGKVELIDIREAYEYKEGSIKDAKNIPMGNLLDEPTKYLSKDDTYYIMCQSGGRSEQACKYLRNRGFDVINVAGGVGAYVGNKRK